MNVLLIVVLSAVILTCVGFATVSILAARKLVASPSPEKLPFELSGEQAIRLRATPLTTLPGSYGFTYDAGRGHARIGSILHDKTENGFVTRTFSSVTGTNVPARGEGVWVRDVYLTPAAMGLPFENVDIVSEAGISPAWVVPALDGSSPTVWAIHLHGIRTTRSVVLPGVSVLAGLGVTSLVVSWRGDTEGPKTPNGTSSLGQEEWRDVEEAVAFAISSGAESVILVGWSMGATIARLVLERSRFRQHVTGMVLISPVTSWRAVIKHTVRAARLPASVAWGVELVLGNRVLRRFAGLVTPVKIADLEITAADNMQPIPTLVFHNPGDNLVPFSAVSATVASSSEHSELVVFSEAPHAVQWNMEPEKFEAALRTWVSTLLRDRSEQRGRG